MATTINKKGKKTLCDKLYFSEFAFNDNYELTIHFYFSEQLINMFVALRLCVIGTKGSR